MEWEIETWGASVLEVQREVNCFTVTMSFHSSTPSTWTSTFSLLSSATEENKHTENCCQTTCTQVCHAFNHMAMCDLTIEMFNSLLMNSRRYTIALWLLPRPERPRPMSKPKITGPSSSLLLHKTCIMLASSDDKNPIVRFFSYLLHRGSSSVRFRFCCHLY